MGRNFKTTQPQNLDYLYKLPENLMLKATDQASQDITENQAALYDLYGKLQLPAIAKDKAEATNLVKGYEDQINGVAQTLQENPLEFRRKTGDILGLQRQMSKDWTSGKAAAIAGRYSQRADWIKQQDELIKNGHLKDPEAATYMLNYLDDKTKDLSYDPVTNNYNQWQGEQLAPHVDLIDRFNSYAKDVQAHTKATAGSSFSPDKKYIYNDGQTEKTLTKTELEDIITQKFLADEDTQKFLKQRSKIGSMTGWYDNKGENLVSPYIKDEKGKTVWNPNSNLANLMQSTADTWDVHDITSKIHTMTADPYGVKAAASGANNVIIDSKTHSLNVVGNPFHTDVVLANGTKVTPTQQYNSTITQNRQVAQKGLTKLYSDLGTEIGQQAINLGWNQSKVNDVISQFKLAYATAEKDGNYQPLHDFLNKNKIASVPIDNLLSSVDEGNRTADNLETQYNRYLEVAQKKLSNGTLAQLHAEVDNMLKNPDYAYHPMLMTATGGDYALTESEKQLGKKAIQASGKYLSDPALWGGNFKVMEDNGRGGVKVKTMTLADLDNGGYIEGWKTALKSKKKTNPFGGLQNTSNDDESINNQTWTAPMDDVSGITLVRNTYNIESEDENGIKKADPLGNVFKLEVPSSKKGSVPVITVFLAPETASSPELKEFENATATKAELDNEIVNANMQFEGVKKAASDSKATISPYLYKISSHLLYNPQTETITIDGAVGPIKDENVRQAAYKQLEKDKNTNKLKPTT